MDAKVAVRDRHGLETVRGRAPAVHAYVPRVVSLRAQMRRAPKGMYLRKVSDTETIPVRRL